MRLQDECGAVRRERVLAAERATAWALLAEPAELEGWLADEVDLEAVEEGAEGTLRWEDGSERRVVVEEVVAERRVAMRWEVADGSGEPDTLVELTLDDHHDGTLLRVLELPLVAVQARGAELPPVVPGGGGVSGGPVLLAA